jgi:hypothetical protein
MELAVLQYSKSISKTHSLQLAIGWPTIFSFDLKTLLL